MLKEHATDDARQMLANPSRRALGAVRGGELDEGGQVMRKRPPTANHG
jgi:hypothetical protein